MMNTLQLQLLDATLRRQPVLSVYLSLTAGPPTDHRAWPLELQNAVKPLRARLQSATHAEREQFERCSEHLEHALRSVAPGDGGRTWVAFVTPAGVHHTEFAAVTTPTIVAWGEGIRLAPYLRLMNEDLPAVVLVCDSAHADLWEYRGGTTRLVERIHAHHASAHEPSHMSAAPKPGFHAGTRGAVGHDDLQRQRHEGTRRMLELAARRARQLVGEDGWICVGGIPHLARHLAQTVLGPRARVRLLKGLDVHATVAQVTDVARASLREMRAERELAGLAETIERATPAGFGVLGSPDTLRALERGRVKELFLTDTFLREHLEDAEWGARHARRQGAGVTILADATAARLDEQGGIAAWLRYRLDGSTAPQKTA